MNAHTTASKPRLITLYLAACCAGLMLTPGPAAASAPAASRPVVDTGTSEVAAREIRKASNRRLQPTVEGSMPARYRFVLNSALPIAAGRVANVGSCARLFSELGADGLEQLAGAIYYLPSDDRGVFTCRGRMADAFTEVGGNRVGLCARFIQLTRWEAAVRLIHEALHHAGMSEQPADPSALSSKEINQLVRARCEL